MGLDVLAVTGGHRVDLEAFLAMVGVISAERGWRWAHAVQPGAAAWLHGGTPERWPAVLLHDLRGLTLQRGAPPVPIDPTPAEASDLDAMLAAGQGLVVLHHALASWPSWDRWADAVGGRFLYAPGPVRGALWPSSGTRLATYDVEIVAPDHPVGAGVPPSFSLSDELYLCPIFEDDVVPLARAATSFDPDGFTSTYEHVVLGEDRAPTCARTGHLPGADLVAWATSAGPSPIVVVQPGDNAATLAVPTYRQLVGNALAWVASPEARAWAEGRT